MASVMKQQTNGHMTRYRYFTENGICPTCQKRELEPGKKECSICRDHRNAYNMVKFSNPEEREKHNKKCSGYQRQMILNRKARGLCTYCGRVRVTDGYSYCGYCRQKERERRLRLKMRREEECAMQKLTDT